MTIHTTHTAKADKPTPRDEAPKADAPVVAPREEPPPAPAAPAEPVDPAQASKPSPAIDQIR